MEAVGRKSSITPCGVYLGKKNFGKDTVCLSSLRCANGYNGRTVHFAEDTSASHSNTSNTPSLQVLQKSEINAFLVACRKAKTFNATPEHIRHQRQ